MNDDLDEKEVLKNVADAIEERIVKFEIDVKGWKGSNSKRYFYYAQGSCKDLC
jgi:hypothetical protein